MENLILMGKKRAGNQTNLKRKGESYSPGAPTKRRNEFYTKEEIKPRGKSGTRGGDRKEI